MRSPVLRARQVVIDAKAASNSAASGSSRGPSKPEPGAEVLLRWIVEHQIGTDCGYRIGDVQQVRDVTVVFFRYRHELITQSEIQGKRRSQLPVVLEISTELFLPPI